MYFFAFVCCESFKVLNCLASNAQFYAVSCFVDLCYSVMLTEINFIVTKICVIYSVCVVAHKFCMTYACHFVTLKYARVFFISNTCKIHVVYINSSSMCASNVVNDSDIIHSKSKVIWQ